ncbi:MAG: phosphotransferase family protein [Zoogloeaceae bacterium]|nr:phosphotransferase family protein [Zoogloeaceae bacterium]
MNTSTAFPHGTRPVASRHIFDPKPLEAWLCANLMEYRGPLKISQFEGGQSNPTFLLATPSSEYVLRKQPPGQLLQSAHAIDREFRVLRALANSPVPVPAALVYCDDASVIGTPFYLMRFLAGRIDTDPLLPTLTQTQRAAAYDSMVKAMAAIHRFDWHDNGLIDYGRPENYLARQLARWSKQYETSRTEDLPAMEQLRDWLTANLPTEQHASLVHGDYRIGNLIYSLHDNAVTAVLDWELSTIGDPFSDLAFNCMTYHLPMGHPVSAGFLGANLAALGIPDEASYLEAYHRYSGLDPRPHWRYYMAFSLYRTAAIQQGVYARALKGNASSRTAHLFGESYRLVAQTGQRLTA